ncbi:MAG: hypothetical protein AVDCRST_MAG40-1625, partial [uncultured Gemmatimonadaceae bacterium]
GAAVGDGAARAGRAPRRHRPRRAAAALRAPGRGALRAAARRRRPL